MDNLTDTQAFLRDLNRIQKCAVNDCFGVLAPTYANVSLRRDGNPTFTLHWRCCECQKEHWNNYRSKMKVDQFIYAKLLLLDSGFGHVNELPF